jgi:hypothetical protein
MLSGFVIDLGRLARALPVLALCGVMSVACGGGEEEITEAGGGTGLSGQGQLPENFGLALLVAGDDEGWLLGTEEVDGTGPLSMWRWVPGQQPEEIGHAPAGTGTDGTGFDGGLALAGVLCDDEDVPEDDWRYECQSAQARIVKVNEAGEVEFSTVLWEKQLYLEDAPGMAFSGTTPSSVLVRTDRTLFEVSTDGTVRQELPASPGLECVVGDDLVAFVDPSTAQPPATGDGPWSADAGMAEEPGSAVEVWKLDGTNWSSEPGGSIRIGQANGVRCSADGAEVYAYDSGQVVASWTPADGWRQPSTSGGEAPPPVVATDRDDFAFVQGQDGSIVEVTSEGYEPTPLSLPAGEEGPVHLTVDASETIVLGCVVRLTGLVGTSGDTTTSPTCDVTGR